MKNDVDTFISRFSKDTQNLLGEMRSIIKELAPEAEESLSYGMPGYKVNGRPLVYFSTFKHHIGLYATPSGHQQFAKELAQYKQGKGSVQFPLDQPLPWDLIRRIVEFRAEENRKER